MDTQEFKTEKSALVHSRKLATAKAKNGTVSVRKVLSSKFKRGKLQQNINRWQSPVLVLDSLTRQVLDNRTKVSEYPGKRTQIPLKFTQVTDKLG